MKKKVPFSAFAAALGLAVLFTFLTTFVMAAILFIGPQSGYSTDQADVFQSVKALYESMFVGGGTVEGGQTENNQADSLSDQINAYIQSMGDVYGQYYTEEEYKAFVEENSGKYKGIGITVSRDDDLTYMYGDEEYKGGLKVIRVDEHSPAYGLIDVGDYVVETEGVHYSTVGYEKFVDLMKKGGEDALELSVVKGVESFYCKECKSVHVNYGKLYIKKYTIERENFINTTVCHSVMSNGTGYIKITEFGNETPEQFLEALIDLCDRGIEKFIFDVRDNPGGQLSSVMSVLSMILPYDRDEEKGALVSVYDKYGKEVPYYNSLSEKYMDYYDIEENDVKTDISSYINARDELTVKAEKSRELALASSDKALKKEYTELAEKYEKMANFDFELPEGSAVAVLVNENTASAGELFTQVLRDYGLSTTVGVTTFGKGTMQSYYEVAGANDLSMGVVKITANTYTSAYSESYNGKGILPDVHIRLRGESASKSLWLLEKEKDAQFIYAFNILNPDNKMELPDESEYTVITK